jgi:3'-5' exoribonuclease
MKDFYICDCAHVENQTITSLFVVAVKQVKSKKNGELYLSLVLADRSGQLQANMWDNVGDAISGFDQDDFVKVKGIVHKYNGRWQLTVHKVRKLGDSEIDYADYLPKTSKDVEQLWSTVVHYVEGFQNPWLKSLLQAFMADDALVAAYKAAPAAKTLHHAFVGGLLDHVVSLFTVADLASRNYPQVNRDLLMTGVFLHDIGKLHELTYQRSIAYTTKGQLLGHMIIELEMLHEKIALVPGFPDELKILIEHMIISHHGQYEFGSPKLPMFPEALMLHYLDDLDSKMESMRAQFERESELETAWTSYNPSLARPLLNTKKFLEKGLTVSRMESPKPSAPNSAGAPASAATESDNDFAEPEREATSQSAPAQSAAPHREASQTPVSTSASPQPEIAPGIAEDPPSSPLEALQRKFESHKVTPINKSH